MIKLNFPVNTNGLIKAGSIIGHILTLKGNMWMVGFCTIIQSISNYESTGSFCFNLE